MGVVLLAVAERAADVTTSFDDQQAATHTVTDTGDEVWDDGQAPSGLSSSLLLDGTGDAIGVTTGHSDFSFGTGDFTVELFYRQATGGAEQDLLDLRNDTGTGFILGLTSTGAPFYFSGGTRI